MLPGCQLRIQRIDCLDEIALQPVPTDLFTVPAGCERVERLAEVQTVILDKTGTLTRPGFTFDLQSLPSEVRSASRRDRWSPAPMSERSLRRASKARREPVTLSERTLT